MKLKLEKFMMEHNCNDERMIKWCLENLDTTNFGNAIKNYGMTPTGFGCSCDTKDIEIYSISGPEHDEAPSPDWQPWMSDLGPNERIEIYYCSYCHEWAIDNDW